MFSQSRRSAGMATAQSRSSSIQRRNPFLNFSDFGYNCFRFSLCARSIVRIAHLRQFLIQNGIPEDQFQRLSSLAEELPESNIAAEIGGLDETEAATLLSRLLRKLAPAIGVSFDHPDVLSQLGFPVSEPAAATSPAAAASAAADAASAATDANHYADGNAG